MMRQGIALLTLGGASLLAAGFAVDLWWLMSAAAGCGLMAGLLGWLRPTPPAAALPAPRAPGIDMAPLLRELAEEMVRLKREGAETSRGMAEARAGAARMAQAAAIAIARLDESAETSAIAARALAMLPGIADSHAQRIEIMAARAEQALAMVPEALAVPPAFEAALARLETIALPDTAALSSAVARLDQLPGDIGQAMHGSLAEAHDATTALLDQASARIEAARPDPLLAVGLMEATERLDALAAPLERARAGAEACASQLDAAWAREAEATAERAIRLGSMTETAQFDAAIEGLAARIEGIVAAPRPDADLLRAEGERLAAMITAAAASLPAAGEAWAALLEPLGAAVAALPPMTESAQRATEALLRAAQANIALAGRAREATEPPPKPPRLLGNLDETIRSLQTLSSAINAAAERRLEPAA